MYCASAEDVFSKDIQKIASGKPLQLPQTPAPEIPENEVQFRLFTRKTKNKTVSEHDVRLVEASKPVKIITHGWNSDAENEWFVNMVNAFLKKGDYNVITVDWSKLSHQEYAIATQNTHGVGMYIVYTKTYKKKSL